MRCQEAASDLIEQLDEILSIDRRNPLLREKEATRRAVWRLLELVAEIADYLTNREESGVVGAYDAIVVRSRLNFHKASFLKPKSATGRLSVSRINLLQRRKILGIAFSWRH